MIDDHPDLGPDPLAGRDPHPREQIDLWPLHDARQELLEEIVSQPGPGNASAPSTRRFLVPVGVAAAVALVAGGAWFVVSSDDNKEDDQVVASSDSPTDSPDDATDPSTEQADEPSEPAEPAVAPLSEVEKGDVLGPQQCRRFRHANVALYLGKDGSHPRDEVLVTLRELDRALELTRLRRDKPWRVQIIRVGDRDDARDRVISVDKACKVVAIDELKVRDRG